MLRFRKFLEGEEVDYFFHGKSVDQLAEQIYADCHQFLTMSGFQVEPNGHLKGAVWRGMSGLNPAKILHQLTPRTDRRPIDTNSAISKVLDEMLERRFGIKYRTVGTFATGHKRFASAYGIPYLMFPIGSFKFAWSPAVEDAFNYFDGAKNGEDPEVLGDYSFSMRSIWNHDDYPDLLRQYRAELKSMIEDGATFGYTNQDLPAAIESKHEIMFHCSSYYLLYDNFPHHGDVDALKAAGQVVQSLGKILNPK